MNLAAHFSRFYAEEPGRLHFAAHSHHPWPDATESAHARYWTDSAARADRKWERVFGEVVPAAQGHVARLLQLPDAKQVAFAPNIHEFVARLYSCLDWSRPLRVLTSAHEFHSFRRQTRRLQETGRLEVVEIPEAPWASFTDRLLEAERSGPWDLVWLSHVFFDSGFVVPRLEEIVDAAPDGALVAIDGYHAFCALSVDLSRIHRRAFYLAGGYKYAMAGEGACFLAVPPGCTLRPVDTGWFAAFERLEDPPEAPRGYAPDAFRFWGSTFDPSGLYRLNAAMDWLLSAGITVAQIHGHARDLQARFLNALAARPVPALPLASLVPPEGTARGNFLTFDIDHAEAVHRSLLEAGIYIDRRGRRIRFGFGIYQDAAMVDRLADTLGRTLR